MGSLLAKNQAGGTCVICEQTKMVGIHLYTSFVCAECESSMINTDTSDPKYKYYVEKLRKVTKPGIYS
ncbi:sigma factor G inhibitor Gin [Bacillus sp. REN3]|uniref:sigma factor G inhibitor Gin n=1 Tax=Bacillus sp. REN3 TaxID=2802440 RepID=UPI0024A69697|nr:sigma factor G inhibitor Gin [Bacillus sp. REN3]